MYRRIATTGLTELLLCLLFALFMLLGRGHPTLLTYLVVGFALVAIASFWYSFQLKRGEGERYEGGELEALPQIRKDLTNLPPGSTVSICGTGVTAIVHVSNEVYHALKRGVNFDVYLMHPIDVLVERLAEMEPDFKDRVFNPIAEHLRSNETVRERLGADWTDGILQVLKKDGNLCDIHNRQNPDDKNGQCSLHSRMICTSAEIWKRVAQRITRNAPGSHPGRLRICYYRLIPFIKAWRFQRKNKKPLYYITDYLHYAGVGIDNPIRRIEMHHTPLSLFQSDSKEGELEQNDKDVPGFINLKRVNAHFELIDGQSEVWEFKPENPTEGIPVSAEHKEERPVRPVQRKPDKTSSPRTVSDFTEAATKEAATKKDRKA